MTSPVSFAIKQSFRLRQITLVVRKLLTQGGVPFPCHFEIELKPGYFFVLVANLPLNRAVINLQSRVDLVGRAIVTGQVSNLNLSNVQLLTALAEFLVQSALYVCALLQAGLQIVQPILHPTEFRV